MTDGVEYPTADEIHAMLERIVARSDETGPGIRTPMAIEPPSPTSRKGSSANGLKPSTRRQPTSCDSSPPITPTSMATNGPPSPRRRISTSSTDITSMSMTKSARTSRAFADGEADPEATVSYLRENVAEKQSYDWDPYQIS